MTDAQVQGLSVAFFVHSWNVKQADLINSLLRPTASTIVPQPEFPARPDATTPVKCVESLGSGYSFAYHQSLWDARRRVMRLVANHEQSTGTIFDAVLLTRLDVCPCQREPLAPSHFALSPGTRVRVGIFHTHCGLPRCPRPFGDHYFRQDATGRRFVAGEVASIFRDQMTPGKDAQSDQSYWRERHMPRSEDTMLLGTTSALHELSEGSFARLPNATLSMGGCDTHGYLALMYLAHFKESDMDVRYADKAEFIHMNRVLVRHELKGCSSAQLQQDPGRCFDLYCSRRPLVGYWAGIEVGRDLPWRQNVDGVSGRYTLPFLTPAPRCQANRSFPATICADDRQMCECNGTVIFTQRQGGRPPGRGPVLPPHLANGFCWSSDPSGRTKCDGRHGDSAPMMHKMCVCQPMLPLPDIELESHANLIR